MVCFKKINNLNSSASRRCMPSKNRKRKIAFFQGVDIYSLPNTGCDPFVNAAEQNDCVCCTFFSFWEKKNVCMGSTENIITKSATKGSQHMAPGHRFVFLYSRPISKQVERSHWMLNTPYHPSQLLSYLFFLHSTFLFIHYTCKAVSKLESSSWKTHLTWRKN